MFRHLILDDWVNTVPMISFGLTALVFLTMMVRAFVMKKDEAEHLANLAVDETTNSSSKDQ